MNYSALSLSALQNLDWQQQQKPILIIGNKNYSSWSLRAWLALHAFGVDFDECQIELFSDTAKPILDRYSPTGKVPVLIINHQDKQHAIWDSLSIAEYVNEHYLAGKGWGADNQGASTARSLACDMHSGLFAIRSQMPMNIRATRRIEPDEQLLAEVGYIDKRFAHYRQQYAGEGDFLLGQFSLVDCFYAPVAFRLATYAQHSGIELSQISKAYCNALLAHPSMVEWQGQALLETSIIEHDEMGEDVS